MLVNSFTSFAILFSKGLFSMVVKTQDFFWLRVKASMIPLGGGKKIRNFFRMQNSLSAIFFSLCLFFHQRHIRVYLAQRRLQHMREAVFLIQRWYRGSRVRAQYTLVRNSAIRIQAHFKGHLTRKR